jgi:hypothetical protein
MFILTAFDRVNIFLSVYLKPSLITGLLFYYMSLPASLSTELIPPEVVGLVEFSSLSHTISFSIKKKSYAKGARAWP